VILVNTANVDRATESEDTPIRLMPLGFKDHSLVGNGLDLSDDDAVNIKTYDGLFGIYQSDTTLVVVVVVDGTTFIITANEGDASEVESVAATVQDLIDDPGVSVSTATDTEFRDFEEPLLGQIGLTKANPCGAQAFLSMEDALLQCSTQLAL